MKPCSKTRSDKSTCANIFLEPTLTIIICTIVACIILEWMHHHAFDHTLTFIHWLLLIIHLQFWHSRRSRIYKQPPELFLKILLISHENTCAGVSYLQSCKPSGLQLYLKKTPTQVFSCEIWEILTNTYFEEHLNDCFCVFITSSYIDIQIL